jgi:hypothetical protein
MIAVQCDRAIDAMQVEHAFPALPNYVHMGGAMVIGVETDSPAIQSKDRRHVGQNPIGLVLSIVRESGAAEKPRPSRFSCRLPGIVAPQHQSASAAISSNVQT